MRNKKRITCEKKERVEWKKRQRNNFLSTRFTLLWKTPAPNIWKIAKYGLLKLGKKIWNRMFTINVKFLLGENTAGAKHEPFIHVLVYLRRLPRLWLDLLTQLTRIRNTRETSHILPIRTFIIDKVGLEVNLNPVLFECIETIGYKVIFSTLSLL